MNRPEQELQIACVKILRDYEVLGKLTFFHVPNQGIVAGKARIGGILKAMGLRAGVPDLVILWSGQVCDTGQTVGWDYCFEGPCAGFIEMKEPIKMGKRGPLKGSGLTDSQKGWRDTLTGMGFNHAVCRSESEMQDILKEWGIV